jgi:hypothetical protein
MHVVCGLYMPRKWTRRECFEHFGASCKNPQWSWSAKSADGRVVVMCMWQDEIKREGDRMVYQSLTTGASGPGGSVLGGASAWRAR